MANNWQTVRLGDLLKRVKEEIKLEDDTTYKEVTVRLWNKGVILRDEKPGIDIKTKRYRVRTGQLILSRIDVRNGAIGIVPPELDGAVVSGEFWTYAVDKTKMDSRFLALYVSTPRFLEESNRTSSGTTHRIRAKEGNLLQIEIPLPPLSEQQRIVTRVDALVRRVEEVRGLRRAAVEQCDVLLRSIIFSESSGAVPTPMRELVKRREPDILVRPEETYHFAGVYCFGKGVFRGRQKSGMDFAYSRLTRLQAGDFVYPKLMAWEGALGIVPPECNGLVVSTEFPVFKVDESRVLPEVLDVYFRTPTVWPTLSAASTGTNVRRRRLNPEDFLKFEMPLPPMSIQLRLRAVQAKVDELRRLQAATQKELDALMPSILAKAFAGEL